MHRFGPAVKALPALANKPGVKGFTLLELIVVLALIAMTMGVIVPATSRWIDSVRERGWRDDLRAVLESLPLRAFRRGQGLVVGADELRLLVSDMPPGLELKLEAPLHYSADGVAAGGRLYLGPGVDGRLQAWTVERTSGRVTVP